MKTARIAIVGAGPAGLTAALAAHKLGLDVTVFEQAPDFRRVGGGLALQSNGLRVLECLDLLESFRPVMRPTRHARVEAAGGRTLIASDLRRLSVPQNLVAVVPRYELQEHLLAAALSAGVPVRFDHKLTDLERTEAGAVLRFAGDGEYETDVVIACDGANSRSRDALGIPARRRAMGQAALRAVVPVRTAADTIREIWGRNGQMFGICPLPGDRTYFYCTLPPGRWAGILGGRVANWVGGWEPFGPDVMTLLRAVPDWTRVNYTELEEIRLREWYRPPAFVVGDAAHAMGPYLGQGANSAMVDAVVLVKLLARARTAGTPLAEVGRMYQELRQPFVTRIQSTARQLGQFARISSAPGRVVREAILWAARQSGPLQRRAMHLTAGYTPAENPYLDPAAWHGPAVASSA